MARMPAISRAVILLAALLVAGVSMSARPAAAQSGEDYADTAPAVALSTRFNASDPLNDEWKAVDGNDTTYFATAVGVANQWWRADLGQSRQLGVVRVFQRGSGREATQWKLQVADATGGPWSDVYTSPASVPLDHTASFLPVSGRYWRVFTLAGSTGFAWCAYTISLWAPNAATATPTATPEPATPTATPEPATATPTIAAPTPTATLTPGCEEYEVGFQSGPTTLAIPAGSTVRPSAGDVYIDDGATWQQLPATPTSIDDYGGEGAHLFYGDGYTVTDNGTPFLLPSRLEVCSPEITPTPAGATPTPTSTSTPTMPPDDECGLILNCSFESGLTSWTVRGSWEGGPVPTTVSDPGIVYGVAALRLADTNNLGVEQQIALPRGRWHLSVYAKYDPASYDPIFGLGETANDQFLTFGDTVSEVCEGSGYCLEVMEVNTTSFADDVAWVVIRNPVSGAAPEILYDRVWLTEVPDETPTPTITITPTAGGEPPVDCDAEPGDPHCIQVDLLRTVISLQRTAIAEPDESVPYLQTSVALQQTALAMPDQSADVGRTAVALQQTSIAMQATANAAPDQAADVQRTSVALQQTSIALQNTALAGPDGATYPTAGPGPERPTLATAVAAVCAKEPCNSANVAYGAIRDTFSALAAVANAPDCATAVTWSTPAGGDFEIDPGGVSEGLCSFLEVTEDIRTWVRLASIALLGFLLWRYLMHTMRRIGDV